MVRILVFHTSYVGSNPTGSNILLKFKYKLFFKLNTIPNNDLESSINISYQSHKQIYVLNTFIFWLTLLYNYKIFKERQINLKLKEKNFILYKGFSKKYSLININFFFILTKKVSKVFTIVKAPMAHKKFSKEQIGFSYYNVTFNVNIITNYFSKRRINFSNVKMLIDLILFIKNEIFNVFCGLFLFHGFDSIFYIKYFFKPIWKSLK